MQSTLKLRFLAWGLLIAFCGTLLAFVAHDHLSSFAEDSAAYLIMGRYLSPFGSPTAALVQAYGASFHPPGFPLLLAISGTAWNLLAAHVLVALCLVASVVVLFMLTKRVLGFEGAALAVAVAFVVLPGTWVNALPILSENFYLLLSLLVLYRAAAADTDNPLPVSAMLADGLLLSMLVLTRSMGITLLASYLVVLPFRGPGRHARLRAFFPALLAIGSIVLWQHWIPNPDAGYLAQMAPVLERTFLGADNGSVDLLTVIHLNMDTLPQAALDYVSVGSHNIVPVSVVLTVALLAVTGVVLRLRQNAMDAYYLVAYFGVLLIWPFPGEQQRFLYPVIPLVLLSAGYAIYWFVRWARSRAAIEMNFGRNVGTLAVGILCATGGPAVASVLARSWDAPQMGVITEYYRYGSLPTARYYATTYNALMDDMRKIGELTPDSATVASPRAPFLTILSGRYSVRLLPGKDPIRQICELVSKGAGYAFISQLTDGHNKEGLRTFFSLRPYTKVVNVIRRKGNGSPASLLLTLDQMKMNKKAVQLRCAG